LFNLEKQKIATFKINDIGSMGISVWINRRRKRRSVRDEEEYYV